MIVEYTVYDNNNFLSHICRTIICKNFIGMTEDNFLRKFQNETFGLLQQILRPIGRRSYDLFLYANINS